MPNPRSRFWTVVLFIVMIETKNTLAVDDFNTIPTLRYTTDRNKSIIIEPFYNDSLDIIQFNITCPDCYPNNNVCEIYVTRILNSCIKNKSLDMALEKKELKFSLDSSLVVVPESNDEFIPFPGCSYLFEDLKNLEDLTQTCNITREISIPPCVGVKCDCNKFNFEFKDLETHLNEDILTIIVNATFEADLNVFAVNFTLSCGGTEIYGNHKDIDYTYVLINVTLQEYFLPYGRNQSCQIELNYLNPHNCVSEHSTYRFFQFDLRNDTKLMIKKLGAMSNSFIFLVPFCGVLIVLIMWIVLTYNRKKSSSTGVPEAPHVTQQTFLNELYSSANIENERDDQHEYNHDEIRILQSIGQGEFGEVFLAKSDRLYKEYRCVYSYIAVKKLKGNATEQAKTEFLQEIALMTKITDFTHVVRLLGYCQKSLPYMLITEYICSGDLKSYLIELRELWRSKSESKAFAGDYVETNIDDDKDPPDTPNSAEFSGCNSRITKFSDLSAQSPLLESENQFNYQIEAILDSNELQNFALQIAKGMAHLETIPIIHRDLAARNILVNECKVLKISDFGLSCMGDGNTSLKEKQQLPVRWTAVDVFEKRMYDTKSDVWSFAVVLWEIGMLGACPYQNIDNTELFSYLRNEDNRLERPPICSDALYDLMLRCWSRDSNLRPTFRDLVDLLDKRKRIYETFEFLNPSYTFPPTEEMNSE